VRSEECPVSTIDARSKALVSIVLESRQVHGASGAVFGGPDSAKWDARWYEAVAILERCRIEEHNARVSAQNAKINSR